MTHIHVVLWNKVPISSVCLTVVVAPRNRFIEHSGIPGPSTSHLCSSHCFLVSSSAPLRPSASQSSTSPNFILLHFPPSSLHSAPCLSISSGAELRHCSVSNHPDLTGHRYTTKAESSTSKSHWDQGTHTLCNLLSCMVAPAVLSCW